MGSHIAGSDNYRMTMRFGYLGTSTCEAFLSTIENN